MKRSMSVILSEPPNKYGKMSRETELVLSIFGRASELITEMLNDTTIEDETSKKLVGT